MNYLHHSIVIHLFILEKLGVPLLHMKKFIPRSRFV